MAELAEPPNKKVKIEPIESEADEECASTISLALEHTGTQHTGVKMKMEKTESGIEEESKDEKKDLVKLDSPLQRTWTFWAFRTKEHKHWLLQDHKEIGEINTAKEFCNFFAENKPILESGIGCNSEYAVFKKGIRPSWEDDANKNGGWWFVKFHKPYRSRVEVNNFWLRLVLCMINESFHEANDEICGAVATIGRGAARIGLWTTTADNKETVINIGIALKTILQPTRELNYSSHKVRLAGKSCLEPRTMHKI